MKLLADENVPSSIIRALQDEGYVSGGYELTHLASLISMLYDMHTRTSGSS